MKWKRQDGSDYVPAGGSHSPMKPGKRWVRASHALPSIPTRPRRTMADDIADAIAKTLQPPEQGGRDSMVARVKRGKRTLRPHDPSPPGWVCTLLAVVALVCGVAALAAMATPPALTKPVESVCVPGPVRATVRAH